MKPFILAFLFLGTIITALAQPGDAGQQFIRKKCRPEHVALPLDPNKPAFRSEYDSIRVIDSRSDTSRIGLIDGEGRSQHELLFSMPVNRQVAAYLKAAYISARGNHSLLVVIKDLWISEPPVREHRMFSTPSWDISFRFEAYLRSRQGYIPFTFLDTLVSAYGINAPNMAAHVLPQLITMFMSRVGAHDPDVDEVVKRTVSFDQIDSFCHARFDYPMDTATKLVKGVYANIDEFKNNQPSILQYEITKDKKSNMELDVPDGNGRFIYTHTVWGFCDGNQIYVMMDGNVFPVFVVQHQFYVLGSKEYQDHKLWIPFAFPLGAVAFVSGAADVKDNVTRSLRLFRLDLRTGEIIE